MTLHLSKEMKKKLTDAKFDDGYLLFNKFTELFVETSEILFIRYSKKLFTFNINKIDDGKNPIDKFTITIKELDKKIDSCNVNFTFEKRAILSFAISIADSREYGFFVFIWNSMNNLSFTQAASMFKEEQLRTKREIRRD